MNFMNVDSINKIQKIIGYKFKNPQLLENAFIHSSFANENRCLSNERLEFLGDSVLSIIVTDKIYHHFKRPEGELSKIRATLVSEASLSKIMNGLELGEFLLVGKGLSHTKPTNAMIADAFEALVAAIYLDSSLESAKEFVLGCMETCFSLIDKTGVPENAKSALQETLPAAKIVYKTTTEGEGLDKIYNSSVFVNGVMSGIGQSTKKKIAEEIAAKEAIKNIKKV